MTTSLTDLPTEVLLLILSFANATDIIALRKTCRIFNGLTADRSIWLSLYNCQSRKVPVPCTWAWMSSPEQTEKITVPQLESLVLSIHQTEERWCSAEPRSVLYPLTLPSISGSYFQQDTHSMGMLLSLDIVSDRWVVAVYQEAAVALWDLHPSISENDVGLGFKWERTYGKGTSPRCRFRRELSGIGLATSSTLAMTKGKDAILLAVSSQNITKITRLNLLFGLPELEMLATFPTPSSIYKVAAIEPSSQLVVFSHSSSVRCLHWPSLSLWTILLTEELDEELWNGVVGIKFLTPRYILCMKTRSVELYSLHLVQETSHGLNHAPTAFRTILSDKGVTATQTIRHRFPEMTYRGASFSDPEIKVNTNGCTAESSFLAYDVLRGLFHYKINTYLPDTLSDDTLHMMDMNIRLISAHKMAQLVNMAGVFGTDTPTPRSGFGSGARGFVSACVLGPQGRRGVWIERQRGNMDRTVFGFSAAVRLERDVAQGEGEGRDSTVFSIDGKRLHEVRNSYDLGEDLTHCAFGEVTGKVVLGNRRGQLFVV